MRIECESCGKTLDLPDNRLPSGKKVSFPCPGCKSKITIDLRVKTAPEPEPAREPAAPSAGKVVITPIAEKSSGELEGTDLRRKILGSIKDLPPMPKVIYKAREVMGNPMSGFKEIAEVIETDQAIAAKVLQVANSAYYGLSGMVSSIHQATVVLGHKTLEQLITMVSATSLLGSRLKGYRMGAGKLWQHSLAVALCSRLIAKDRAPAMENDAFSVGLIHDAGKLALDRYILERSEQVEKELNAGASFLEVEKKVLGFDHTELALDLCTKWNLPENHASAMRYHHEPSASDGNQLAYIVHTANHIAQQCDISKTMDAALYTLDPQALDFLALDETDLANYQQATTEAVSQITQNLM
ncbi:putative signal transduction protein [Desulfosarcina cetonica]|uniref:HDOD domain-containing protein n=1 Tax=Desulfosarcina cetonica TaxID=90730 RepID=UPI0006CF99C6|nr:HDOD domain-containing protein [Desulfosarcina cetonica]VTR64472.1 putative signal transduction protein [Desulfosarcina cetonica]